MLHQVIAAHLEAFLGTAAEAGKGSGLPQFVERELREFLKVVDRFDVRALPKYLTQDELQRLFAAIPCPRDRALFAVIYHYALRVDEATALTVEDQ